MKSELIQQTINHIGFVIDESYSMRKHRDSVVTVFDNQIKHLARRSKEMGHETRASVYFFSEHDRIRCVIYDQDVLRVPSLAGYYKPDHNTALCDATALAISELKQTACLHGDHAFLLYVITDGEENASQQTSAAGLRSILKTLPENWTLAVLVPNQTGVHEAKAAGFLPGNIDTWDTDSADAVESVGMKIQSSVDRYLVARSSGVRSVKNLFTVDAGFTQRQVVTNLEPLRPDTDYHSYPVRRSDDGKDIKGFVQSWSGEPYRLGSAYYELTKPETIQRSKQIVIMEKRTGNCFTGDGARGLLGLPSYEVKVAPGDFAQWRIFVQSTSVNRKLVADTLLLVLR